MATITIGKDYDSILSSLKEEYLSKSPTLTSRVIMDDELTGGPKCYCCSTGPDWDNWMEVRRTINQDIGIYYFHKNCFLELAYPSKI